MATLGPAARALAIDVFAGTLVGGAVGAIVAVNLVIVAGPDQGYESTPSEVFEHSTILGLVTAAILVGGPPVGVLVARMARRRRR
ncbi:MAG: hypothetical protein AAGA99_13115 [Actinomycetota bacterium]